MAVAMVRTLVFAPLEWLGRQGTRAVAALVLLGIALPPVDRLLRPYVTEAVVALLCIAFMRLDLALLRRYLSRPGIVLAATGWTTLAVPALFAAACLGLGLDVSEPDLFLGLMLQGVASPMMAAPAFAALMGLDATLVLLTLVTSTALVPLTAPVFVHLFTGQAAAFTPLSLGLKLFAILAGSAAAGLLLRRLFGAAAIERRRVRIDGLNILILYVFVAAVMEDVGPGFLAAPLRMLGLTALAFAVCALVLALSTLAFAWAGRERALALGFMASQRNMGLMLAATGGALPELTWLYFALAQFPIYLGPLVLKPLVARRARGAS
jgi:BASS family bile acid:Na+ symporter